MDRLRLSVIIIFLGVSCALPAQETRFFDLKSLPTPQKLQHYQVTGITDGRYDTTTLGTLQLGFPTRKPYIIKLQQGAAKAFSTYIDRNFKQDTQSMPVRLRIKRLTVRELTSGIRPEIGVELVTEFFIGEQRLTEYKLTGSVKTMGDQLKQVSDLLGQYLQSTLAAFDEWWNIKQNVYAPNAPVAVEVIINNTPDTSRFITYSKNRPLTVSDFQAMPDPRDKAVALTASYIRVKYSLIEDSASLRMLVVISTYFDKEKSWFRQTAYNSTVLLHEQGHFDIAAIKACELADSLRGKVFTKTNCYEMVDRIQAKKKMELLDMQELYDGKTGHGVTPSVQASWSRTLKEMLRSKYCFD